MSRRYRPEHRPRAVALRVSRAAQPPEWAACGCVVSNDLALRLKGSSRRDTQSAERALLRGFGLLVAAALMSVASPSRAQPSVGPPGPSRIMTIDECIEYALAHSPELEKLRIAEESQLLNTVIEKARFAFNVTSDGQYENDPDKGSYSVGLNKELGNGVTVTTSLNAAEDRDDDVDSAGFSVTLSKKILGGGTPRETRQRIHDSLLDETIALNRIRRERRNLAFRVRRRIYQTIRDAQSLSV